MAWRKTLTIRGHGAPVYACFYQDSFIYSAAGDRFVTRWDPATGKQDSFAVKLESPAYALYGIPEQHQLLIGCANGTIVMIDTNTRQLLREQNVYGHAIFSLVAYPEERWLLAGDAEGNLIVLDENGTMLTAFPLNCGKIRQLLLHDHVLFIACQDGTWRSFDLPTFNETHKQQAHLNGVHALLYDHSGKTLITGGRDAHIRVWDLLTNHELHAFPAHYQTIYGILSMAGNTISVSMDKTIKIWDENWQIVQRIETGQGGHQRSVNGCLQLPDGKWLTYSDDKTLRIWQQEN